MRGLFAFAVFALCFFTAATARAADPVADAHSAYLEGRFDDMAQSAHAAFLAHPGDQAVRKNLVQLFDAAYAQGAESQIKPDWTLPPGIRDLAVYVKRVSWKNDQSFQYMFAIGGCTDKPGAVADLRLIRHPGKTVLDKTGGLGTWREYEYPKTKKTAFYVKKFVGQEPPADGLYEFEIRLTGDAKTYSGWFVLFNMDAKAVPALVSPEPDQNIAAERPRFSWQPLRSPASRDYETRLIQVSVAADASNCEKDYVWEAYAGSDLMTITLGDYTGFTSVDLDETPQSDAAILAGRLAGNVYHAGVKNLADGLYVLDLKYLEAKRFGPLLLKRFAISSTPFAIGNAQVHEIECGGE